MINKFDPVDVIAVIGMIGSFVCCLLLPNKEPFVKVLEAIIFFYIVKKGGEIKTNK